MITLLDIQRVDQITGAIYTVQCGDADTVSTKTLLASQRYFLLHGYRNALDCPVLFHQNPDVSCNHTHTHNSTCSLICSSHMLMDFCLCFFLTFCSAIISFRLCCLVLLLILLCFLWLSNRGRRRGSLLSNGWQHP